MVGLDVCCDPVWIIIEGIRLVRVFSLFAQFRADGQGVFSL